MKLAAHVVLEGVNRKSIVFDLKAKIPIFTCAVLIKASGRGKWSNVGHAPLAQWVGCGLVVHVRRGDTAVSSSPLSFSVSCSSTSSFANKSRFLFSRAHEVLLRGTQLRISLLY